MRRILFFSPSYKVDLVTSCNHIVPFWIRNSPNYEQPLKASRIFAFTCRYDIHIDIQINVKLESWKSFSI